MKKSATLLFFLAFSIAGIAQSIQLLSIFPANPTTNDPIQVIGNLEFTSGGCEMVGSGVTPLGTTLNVNVKHCPGMLTFICNVSDTVNLGTLPAGTYTLNFFVDVGTYNAAGICDNFITTTQQSLSFTVTGTSSIITPGSSLPKLTFLHDSRQLVLSGTNVRTKLRIMDITGRILFNSFVNPGEVSISGLPSQGILIYSLQTIDGKEKAGRIVIH
ncbi:MAG: hypothetical protein RIQ47_239 [Bacteroidota bacterium]|jgi:hypothetical protein